MPKVIEGSSAPPWSCPQQDPAAQLCAGSGVFPNNAVEYFVRYYDYYQPEAYIPHTDTFIEKDSAINDEIERLRHSATSALFERRDVIVVASVSCIYGLGDPIDYANMVISLRTGQERTIESLLSKLTEIRYERNDVAFDRNRFRVRGDTVEIFPVYAKDHAIRVEFFGDDRPHQRDQCRHRHPHPRAGPRGHLSRLPLRRVQRENGGGDPRDLPGDGGAGRILQGQRPAHWAQRISQRTFI